LKEDLRIIIQEPIDETEVEPFKNAKRLYEACTNVNLIETRGTTDLDSLTSQWPVVTGNGTPADWTWQKSVVESRNNGYSASYFFSFSVSTDNRDSTKRVIRVSEYLTFELYIYNCRLLINILLIDRSSQLRSQSSISYQTL
jgi:hypothetical protein